MLHRYRPVVLAALLCFFISDVYTMSNSLVLKDGRVFIGTVSDGAAGTVALSSAQGELQIDAREIREHHRDIDSLIGSFFIVTLVDGSVFRGDVVDIDAEIGVFIDSAYGPLNIPFDVIEEIHLRDRRISDNPEIEHSVFLVGLGISVAGPVTPSVLERSYGGRTVLQWIPPRASRIRAAQIVEFLALTEELSQSLRYRLTDVSLVVYTDIVSLVERRTNGRAVSLFGSLGAGGTFTSVVDERPLAVNPYYGTMNAHLIGGLGLRVPLARGMSLSLESEGQLVFQDDGGVWIAGGTIAFHTPMRRVDS